MLKITNLGTELNVALAKVAVEFKRKRPGARGGRGDIDRGTAQNGVAE